MKAHQNFLRFNDKPIFFINKDGELWISLPSLCEALGIDARHHYRKAKKDYVIGPELKLLPMLTSTNDVSQVRNVTCLPEFIVYGWLMTINVDNPELKEYRKTCFHLLHNFFKGSINNRKDLLIDRREIDTEIFELKKSLKEEDEKYKRLQELQNQRKTVSTQLNSIDKDLIKEPELFDEKPVEQV